MKNSGKTPLTTSRSHVAPQSANTRRSRRIACIALGAIGVAVLALFGALTAPLWAWIAYDTKTVTLTEIPLIKTGPYSARRDRSKPTYERVAREKRLNWGPGKKFLVEREVCYGCLHDRHQLHQATVALQEAVTRRMIAFDCVCEICSR